MRYRVTPLDLGEAEVGSVLDVFWSLTKNTGKVTVPILGFLIEGVDHPIVVDTGMRSAQRASEVHKLGRHSEGPEQTLPAALAKHGLAPEDTRACILTHPHYDHAGGCELLPNANFYMQRSELAAAATPIGPKTLEIGSGDLSYDRLDVAALVSPLWIESSCWKVTLSCSMASTACSTLTRIRRVANASTSTHPPSSEPLAVPGSSGDAARVSVQPT